MMDIDWRIEREFWGANQAEHAIVGDYELVAFDIPADARGDGAAIGWEIFTGAPKFLDLVAKGDAPEFMAAKRAAETYFATIGGSETHH